MKSPLTLLVCLLISAGAFAQDHPETGLALVDSLDQKVSLPELPDTLLHTYYIIDSIRTSFNRGADSIRTEYQQTLASIDASKYQLQNTLDSISQYNLPTGKLTAQIDSVNALRQETVNKLNSKLADLKSKTVGKLSALDLPPQYQEPITQLTQQIESIGVTGDILEIPALEMPGFKMPEINGIADLKHPKIETPLGDLGELTEKAQAYKEDLRNLTEGNLEDVKELPNTLEQKAADFAGVDELEKQSAVLDQYKSQAEMLKDPATGKEKAVEMAKKVAVDHFAGKEKELKSAMEQMAKYKQKYSSVSSIKDLPKRPPNAMKGKPFVERLVPGLYFQYQVRYYNLFDFNPYLGYRISGRITAGAGWNERIAYDRRTDSWTPMGSVFGPRGYVDVRLGRGFIAHVESEVMNSFVPAIPGGNPEVGQREWVWGMMTGLKKEYKIYRNLRGTVLLQYNLFNPHFKAPYADRLNSRVGFEYQIKKRRRNPDQCDS